MASLADCIPSKPACSTSVSMPAGLSWNGCALHLFPVRPSFPNLLGRFARCSALSRGGRPSLKSNSFACCLLRVLLLHSLCAQLLSSGPPLRFSLQSKSVWKSKADGAERGRFAVLPNPDHPDPQLDPSFWIRPPKLPARLYIMVQLQFLV
jgi:hypothetical protein